MPDLKSVAKGVQLELLKADFRNFLAYVWRHLRLPPPTPVQYDIAYRLQHGPRRYMVEAFRGVGKSWITSAFAVWLLLVDPQLKIEVISAAKDRSDAFSTFTKRLIYELPVCRHLIPRKDQRDSNITFDVGPARADHSPSVKSVGITGQITGSRADVIIADDIETPKNSLTQTMRDRLAELVKEFDAILKPGGRVIYLGTPQTEMSLYNQLPERGYTIEVWPSRVPKPDKVAGYKGRLAKYVEHLIEQGTRPWTPVDPDRFDEMDLMEREASYGRSGFALQFQLDTSMSDAEKYPLKCSDFLVMDLNPELAPGKVVWGGGPEQRMEDLECPGFVGDQWNSPMFLAKEWTEYTGALMFIDPSGRGEDETGYAVVKVLNGRMFLTAAGGFKGGYADETLKALVNVAKQQKVNLILCEPNFGDGMFVEILKPVLKREGYPCTIEDAPRATMQKERRIIDVLEPVLNQHRLVVDRQLILDDLKRATEGEETDANTYALFWQLTRITKERGALKHDDRLDALAGAVAYWVESMARDEEDAFDQQRTEALEKELKSFMDNAIGATPDDNTWFTI